MNETVHEGAGHHDTGRPAEHSDTRNSGGGYDVTSANRTVHYAHNRGRASSWIAVVIMILTFAVGGLGVILTNWVLVIVCAAVFVLAFIGALIGGIMSDVH